MARFKEGEVRKQSRPDLSAMVKNWPSSHVERSKVGEFSGGAVAPGTLANLDSRGLGPEGATHIGRRVIYSSLELVKWLEDRAEGTLLKRVY